MTPFFHIVIVVYNNGPEVQETLNGLAEQENTDFCVTILDNDCPIQSTDALALPDSRFQLIHSPENLGFAGGCNLAAQEAATPWLIMLNPDAKPLPNWLTEVKRGIDTYDAAMFGSTQIMESAPDISDGFGDVWSIFGYCWRGGYDQSLKNLPDEDQRVLSPCAAASVYRRDYFERLGGFDTAYFCYLEDVDLGLRMQAIGSDCIQLRDAIVIHMGGQSQDEGSHYGLTQSAKNAPRLIIKNAPFLILPLMLALYITSQAWFKMRAQNSPQSQARWDSVKSGLSAWRQHKRSRKQTKRMSVRALFAFLDFRMKSLRSLPIRSQPIQAED